MTLEQTRQLGIEFERRIQAILPEKEYIDKMDTDTIYSFLNQYQDKFIHEIYKQLDQIEENPNLHRRIELMLEPLLSTFETGENWVFGDKFPVAFTDNVTLINDKDENAKDTIHSYTYQLPKDFHMYIRSVSEVSTIFRFAKNKSVNNRILVVPNQLVSQTNVHKLIETPYNDMRILRNPLVVLDVQYKNKPTITIVHDRFTTIKNIKVLYYRHPMYFSILKSIPCELPMDAFDDLVSGAVQLYIQYVAGGKNKQPDEQNKKQESKED